MNDGYIELAAAILINALEEAEGHIVIEGRIPPQQRVLLARRLQREARIWLADAHGGLWLADMLDCGMALRKWLREHGILIHETA